MPKLSQSPVECVLGKDVNMFSGEKTTLGGNIQNINLEPHVDAKHTSIYMRDVLHACQVKYISRILSDFTLDYVGSEMGPYMLKCMYSLVIG